MHVANKILGAIDQDTQSYDAMHALMGDFVGMDGSRLDKKTAEILSDTFGAYTGQNCFVTEVCTDGSAKEKGKDQVCPSGFSSMSTAHNPIQAPGRKIKGECSKGWYRHICCPTKNQPKNCRWNGAPERNVIGCSGRCGEGQFKLNSDTFLNADGRGMQPQSFFTVSFTNFLLKVFVGMASDTCVVTEQRFSMTAFGRAVRDQRCRTMMRSVSKMIMKS